MEETFECPQNAASFSKKILPAQSIKSQKWLVKVGTPSSQSKMLQPENLMPSENRHHGESSRTALLSQNSAAKTARVDYQVVPLPQCHNRCATRALTLAICKHQNMKQSKRLQLDSENGVVLAAASTWATRLPPPSPGSAGRFKSAPAGRPSPLSAGARFRAIQAAGSRDGKRCPQPP